MTLVNPTQIIGAVTRLGADVVPSPSLDQVWDFIRASKAENTLRGYHSVGAISVNGAS